MTGLLQHLVDAAARVGLNYSFLLDPYEREPFIRGATVTLQLTGLSILCGLLLGVVFAAMLTSGRPWLARPTRWFVEAARNTPTLVQLYVGFLVLNMLLSQALGADRNPFTAFAWVVIIVSLHIGAFHAEALRAGIEAVPKVTLEASSSLGFSPLHTLLYVQLPLALRFALPSIVNNLIEMVKMTAVASAIAVGDITYESIMIWTQRDNVFELMLLILVFFSALTFGVNRIGLWLEQRLRMPGYGQ